MKIQGVIERITYFNQENGYTVIRLRPSEDAAKNLPGVNLEGLITVVGNLPEIAPGESVHFQGDLVTHPKHGLQFEAKSFKKQRPYSIQGIERYLGSGLIKGIGPQLAKRIVRCFKEETLDIIEENPERLREVRGIGTDRTEMIIQAWEEQRKVKEIMLFLQEHRVSTNLAVKIYRTYGEDSINVVKGNPYQLEQDIYGIGFKTADVIAQNLGLPSDHPSRIEAGIIYVLQKFIEEGHVFTPERKLVERSAELLVVDQGFVLSAVDRLTSKGRVKKGKLPKNFNEIRSTEMLLDEIDLTNPIIYLTPYYFSESGLAKKIQSLNNHPVSPWQSLLFLNQNQLSKEQKDAIEAAILNPVSVITGGPGTGKTTCLKALIQILEAKGHRYALTSPTGRAAKRLSEATERPASTIHRLLNYSPNQGFGYNVSHPLRIDFLVIDEASMLDLVLAYHLLQAVKPGTQVLFVGDVDQLPSVGAGDVLRDLINSGKVSVSRLETIHRQSLGSGIIGNAHRINHGHVPNFSQNKTGDFFLFPAEDAITTADWIVDLVSHRLPDTFGLNPIDDIQVLAPLYRGEAGVDTLNVRLQEAINPYNQNTVEQKLFGRLFRIGDKVMQIQNNYDKNVYNGDIGRVVKLNRILRTLTILMDGTREVQYDFSEADELVLAYAVSVHKSQGSEFPAVVIPVITQHFIMLQRNLLYTAITRAKGSCVLVGNFKAIRIAINNNKTSKRFSLLSYKI